MARQNEVREAANFHNGAQQFSGKLDRMERTPIQIERESTYSLLERKRRDTHREEWRRVWGFLRKEGDWSKTDLEWLESELFEHLPRITHRGVPVPRTDADRQIPLEMKLVLTLDYHMWVAPIDWWKMYFETLRENASL